MRRGCIAVQPFNCDTCGRVIKHPERYLAMDETDLKPKASEGKLMRLCVECARKKGFASYRIEKGETVLTFLDTKES